MLKVLWQDETGAGIFSAPLNRNEFRYVKVFNVVKAIITCDS